MKRFLSLLSVLAVAATLTLAGPCYADGLDLATKNTKNMPSFTGGAASGDVMAVFDASQDKWTTRDARTAIRGTGFFEICGDATTVNNNTVYYGPDQTVVSSATVGQVNCDTTAAGSATEATADAPALSATAIYPTGMVCHNPDNASGITYTLRSAEAAVSPAIATTLADNILSNAVSVQATTAIAAGATVAVAVSSTGDIGTIPFICRVHYVY